MRRRHARPTEVVPPRTLRQVRRLVASLHRDVEPDDPTPARIAGLLEPHMQRHPAAAVGWYAARLGAWDRLDQALDDLEATTTTGRRP